MTNATITDTIVRGLALTGEMAWDTWWALVLGLTISGAVEVFVSEAWMRRVLGGDGWREVGLGAGLGVASSSCSYSAVGTTKTLFKKGASAPAALGGFMFASTDLVVELGLAMWVLLGWQFVVGEYLGGLVAVAVLALLFRRVVPDAWIEAARDHVRATDGASCATCDAAIDPDDPDAVTRTIEGRTERFCCSGCASAFAATRADDGAAVLSADGWRSAASATMKDWEMIGRDLLVGFLVAGFVGAAVPQAWWTALFASQATFGGVLRNAVLAVVVGILTVMCSVGNVPFALVLWRNGLPFGGVLAFVYADLLIPPLLSLYRRYYGLRMAATLFGALFVAAVVAGVVVHYVLGWAGLVPSQGLVGGTLAGEYTTVLNAALTPVFAGQVLAAYGRDGVRRGARSALVRTRRAVARVETWVAAAAFAVGVSLAVLADVASPVARRVRRRLPAGFARRTGDDAASTLRRSIPVEVRIAGASPAEWTRRLAEAVMPPLRLSGRAVRSVALLGWSGVGAVADEIGRFGTLDGGPDALAIDDGGVDRPGIGEAGADRRGTDGDDGGRGETSGWDGDRR